jgi:hypothetical protein
MAVPLPDHPTLTRPDAEEVHLLARGFLSMMAPASGPTELQQMLVEAISEAMTGYQVHAAGSRRSSHVHSPKGWPAAISCSAPGRSKSVCSVP